MLKTAEHFVSKCSFYDAERAECKRRLGEIVAGEACPRFTKAMQENAPEIFLGAKWLMELPADKRHRLDHVICDYLKVTWRKRDALWTRLTDRKGWKLK